MGYAVDGIFDRHGDLLLDLFRGDSGPLSDDLDVVIGDVRVGFHGETAEGDDTPDEQQNCDGDGQQTICKTEVNEASDHAESIPALF